MKIQIISKKIDQKVLLELTNAWFKSFVKFVVDIKTGQLAVGGELHSDAELLLLENGAEQSNLWGGNFFPNKFSYILIFTITIQVSFIFKYFRRIKSK